MLDENGNLVSPDPQTVSEPPLFEPPQQISGEPAVEPLPQVATIQADPVNSIPKKRSIPKLVVISIALVLFIFLAAASFFVIQNMNKSKTVVKKSPMTSNSIPDDSTGWGNLAGNEVSKRVFRAILTSSYGETTAKEMANSREFTYRHIIENSETWSLLSPDETIDNIFLDKVKLNKVTHTISANLDDVNYVPFDTVIAGDAYWTYLDNNTNSYSHPALGDDKYDETKSTETFNLAKKIAEITYPEAKVKTRTGFKLYGEYGSPGVYVYPFSPRGGFSVSFMTSGIQDASWYTK